MIELPAAGKETGAPPHTLCDEEGGWHLKMEGVQETKQKKT